LLIRCSLYDFYNIICISSVFVWPYVHLDIPVLTMHVCCGGEYSYTPHNDVSVDDGPHIRRWSVNIIILYSDTGRFIKFFVITNIYNKKTKGPTLMELFTATGKLISFDN